jgi:ribonucleotide monophosphatase NagD (HAD superfamily)
MQLNVGKGGHWLFPYLLQRYHLSPSEACIIGDRLDTDIAMGKEGAMVTILPLTGECKSRLCTYVLALKTSVMPTSIWHSQVLQ